MSAPHALRVAEVLDHAEAVLRDEEVDFSDVTTPADVVKAQLELIAHLRDQLCDVLAAEEGGEKPAVSVDTALGIIKYHLGLEPMVTSRGDQVKCYVPDLDEGGTCKSYFDAKELYELAECFAAVAAALRVGEGEKP